ncbi:MAG: GNAT family N-acetyltransferase [Candidatus Burarchaeum sp.]|nr:GNAT family N-acetyltransferase [Candidatus Burarchaeum sp.]MDO8339341.1 GNAT family N-acetyltransferase [Candidatus Burarchaeum sp.]
MGIIVRRMGSADADAIAELSQKYFPLARIDEAEVRRRTARGVQYFVAERDGNLAGFVDVKLGARQVRIGGIAVTPDCERHGIGSALLERAVAFARENGRSSLSLLVKESNAKALRFYTQRGFALKGARIGKRNGTVLVLVRGIEN